MLDLETYRGKRWGIAVTLYVAAFMTAGCGTSMQFLSGRGLKYQYTYELSSPVQNRNMLFRDDNVIIQFSFDAAAISFQLQNISREYLTIDWGRAAIGVNGMFSLVRHTPTLYRDSADLSSSIVLPPVGYIRDLLIPYENMRFDGERWTEYDLLPTTDRNNDSVRLDIMGSVGRKVNIVLPLRIGERTVTYEFECQVASVRQISWRDYVAPMRIPGPPTLQRVQNQRDQVTFAIIAVGFLGFLAYVLSIPKDPPVE